MTSTKLHKKIKVGIRLLRGATKHTQRDLLTEELSTEQKISGHYPSALKKSFLVLKAFHLLLTFNNPAIRPRPSIY